MFFCSSLAGVFMLSMAGNLRGAWVSFLASTAAYNLVEAAVVLTNNMIIVDITINIYMYFLRVSIPVEAAAKYPTVDDVHAMKS